MEQTGAKEALSEAVVYLDLVRRVPQDKLAVVNAVANAFSDGMKYALSCSDTQLRA